MLNFAKTEPVAMTVAGQSLFVHPMTAGRLAQLLTSIDSLKKSNEAYKADFELLMASIKDAEGKCVFASIQEAMDVPPGVAAELIPACLRINGMGSSDEKKD